MKKFNIQINTVLYVNNIDDALFYLAMYFLESFRDVASNKVYEKDYWLDADSTIKIEEIKPLKDELDTWTDSTTLSTDGMNKI